MISAIVAPKLVLFCALEQCIAARAGILPDATEDEIRGMSTQDGIAKIGVCVQIAWFLIQSLARIRVGLPLTLHVRMHVVCAFVMYGVWYHKPYTGSAPYICKDRRVIDMTAFVLP